MLLVNIESLVVCFLPGKVNVSILKSYQQTYVSHSSKTGRPRLGSLSELSSIKARLPNSSSSFVGNVTGKRCQHLDGNGGYEAKPSSIVSLSVIVSSGWCLPFLEIRFPISVSRAKKGHLEAMTSPVFPKEALP